MPRCQPRHEFVILLSSDRMRWDHRADRSSRCSSASFARSLRAISLTEIAFGSSRRSFLGADGMSAVHPTPADSCAAQQMHRHQQRAKKAMSIFESWSPTGRPFRKEIKEMPDGAEVVARRERGIRHAHHPTVLALEYGNSGQRHTVPAVAHVVRKARPLS